MSSSIKLTNSSGKIVTITNPDTTSADVAVDLLNNAYTIATVDDFGTVPVGYTTVIVKDTDRGGVFNRIASTTANGGTIFDGTTGYSWERQYSGAVNVKWFGAVGDSDLLGSGTDDVAALRAAAEVGTIYLPEGYFFKCSGTIMLFNGVTGKGAITYTGTGTLFQVGYSGTYPVAYTTASAAAPDNVKIEDAKFFGVSGISNTFVRVVGGDNFNISDVYLRQFGGVSNHVVEFHTTNGDGSGFANAFGLTNVFFASCEVDGKDVIHIFGANSIWSIQDCFIQGTDNTKGTAITADANANGGSVISCAFETILNGIVNSGIQSPMVIQNIRVENMTGTAVTASRPVIIEGLHIYNNIITMSQPILIRVYGAGSNIRNVTVNSAISNKKYKIDGIINNGAILINDITVADLEYVASTGTIDIIGDSYTITDSKYRTINNQSGAYYPFKTNVAASLDKLTNNKYKHEKGIIIAIGSGGTEKIAELTSGSYGNVVKLTLALRRNTGSGGVTAVEYFIANGHVTDDATKWAIGSQNLLVNLGTSFASSIVVSLSSTTGATTSINITNNNATIISGTYILEHMTV